VSRHSTANYVIYLPLYILYIQAQINVRLHKPTTLQVKVMMRSFNSICSMSLIQRHESTDDSYAAFLDKNENKAFLQHALHVNPVVID